MGRNDPFDNLAGRATNNSDAFGQGSLPAPVGKRDPFAQATASFSKNAMDSLGTGLFSEDIIGETQGGPSAIDQALHGTFSPIKYAIQGLTWWQETVTDPIAGIASSILYSRKGNEDLYEDTVEDGSGFWLKFGEFERKREGYGSGILSDKFFLSLFADPTTYLGWGLVGKIPKILGGTYLGVMETAFMRTTNVPFTLGSKAYSKLPGLLGLPANSSGQTARIAATHASESMNQAAFEKFGKQLEHLNLEETDEFVAILMRASSDPKTHGQLTPAMQKVKSHLFDREMVTRVDIDEAIRFGNRSVGDTIIQPMGKVFDEEALGRRVDLTDALIALSEGRLVLDEVAQIWAGHLGVANSDFVDGLKNWLSIKSDAHVRGVEAITKNKSGRAIREIVAGKANEISKAKSREGFEHWAGTNGMWGSMVQTMDNVQTALYQQGIRKWFVDPMKTYVLSFIGFPMTEIVESGIRQVTGRSGMGTHGRASFVDSFGDVPGMNQLLDEDSIVPFVQSGDLQQDFGIREMLEKAGLPLPERMFKQLDLLGRKELEVTNKMASLSQRFYVHKRAVNEFQAVLEDEFPGMAKAIAEIPDSLGTAFHSTGVDVQQELLVRAMTGSDDIVDMYIRRMNDAVIQPDVFGQGMKNTPIIGNIVGHFQRKALHNTIDRVAGNQNLSSGSSRLLHEWADSGGSLTTLEKDILPQAVVHERKKLMEGPLAKADNLSILALAAKNAKVGDVQGAKSILSSAHRLLTEMKGEMHNIRRDATKQARPLQNGSAEKIRIHEESLDAIQVAYDRADELMQTLMPELNRITPQSAKEFKTLGEGFSSMKEISLREREELTELFSRKSTMSDGKFFDELRDIRDAAGEQYGVMYDGFTNLSRDLISEFDKVHALPTVKLADSVIPKTFGNKLSMEDIAYISGGTSETVTQAIAKAAVSDKAVFTDWVMKNVKNMPDKFVGVTPEKIGKAYERILKQFGHNSKSYTMSKKSKQSLQTAFLELKKESIAPKFAGKQADDLLEYVERVKEAMKGSEGALKARRDKIMKESVLPDWERQFVNYDNQTSIDEFMKAIFPFWTYEARRPGYIARTFIQNPATANLFGPEGRYWDATGDGYVQPGKHPWFDINPLSGGMFGVLRRTWKSEFPHKGTEGFQSGYDRTKESMARLGFYPGSHVELAVNGVLPFMGGEMELGEALPPPFSAGLGALEAAKVPGAQALRKHVFTDKFHKYNVSKVIWNNGLNPKYLDFDTWESKDESKLTQDDISEALQQVGIAAFITEQAGVVRYRPGAERDYRLARDTMLSQYSGLSIKEIEKARRQGRNPIKGLLLSPEQRRILNDIPGQEEWITSVNLLQTPQERKTKALTIQFHEEATKLRDNYTAEQDADDTALLSGVMRPEVWRDRRGERGTKNSTITDTLRGTTKGSDGELIDIPGVKSLFRDVPVTAEEYLAVAIANGTDVLALGHPVKEYLNDYFSIQPRDLNNDGVMEWGEYNDRRKDFLADIDPEYLPEVQAEIARNDSPLEAQLRILSDGILGEYWQTEEDVAKEMGVTEWLVNLQEETDQDLIDREMKRSWFKRYRREIQKRKERMRQTSAELDYALNLYGFTGNQRRFKNREAEAYWKSNGADLRFFKAF